MNVDQIPHQLDFEDMNVDQDLDGFVSFYSILKRDYTHSWVEMQEICYSLDPELSAQNNEDAFIPITKEDKERLFYSCYCEGTWKNGAFQISLE